MNYGPGDPNLAHKRDEHVEIAQDEDAASYEGWFRAPEATIHWASHIDQIYDLIRAANPAPARMPPPPRCPPTRPPNPIA